MSAVSFPGKRGRQGEQHTYLPDHLQEEFVQLPLHLDGGVQLSVVEGDASPDEVARDDLLVLLVEGHSADAPPELYHPDELPVRAGQGLEERVARAVLEEPGIRLYEATLDKILMGKYKN